MAQGMSNNSVVCLIASTGEVGGSSAAWGSSGPATRKLHGITSQTFTITETIEAPAQVGYLGPGPVAEEVQSGAEFSLEGNWTYEEAPKLLNGFFTFTSATTEAVSTSYPYYWFAPVGSTQVNQTYPLEFGTTNNPYRCSGAVFNELTISGEAPGLWNFTVGGFGKRIETISSGMSTAANADSRTVNPVTMRDTQLRIHPTTVAVANFASSSGRVDGTLISFELNYNPARHAKFFAGSAGAQSWGEGKAEATLRTVLEFTSSQASDINSILPDISTQGDITSTGAPLERFVTIYATKQGTSSEYVSQIQFSGIVASPINLFGDRDGNATLELEWQAKFSTGLAVHGSSGVGGYLGFVVTNKSSMTS